MTANPCAIALGSNLGDSLAILRGALAALDQHPDIAVVACSRVYQTAPVGPPQPDYLNACALLRSHLAPAELLHLLLAVERQFGRERRERWGARRLDLDLLLFDDLIIETAELEVPHPRMWERAFVLVPLAEVAPDWQNPRSGVTVADIRATLADQDVAPIATGQSLWQPE